MRCTSSLNQAFTHNGVSDADRSLTIGHIAVLLISLNVELSSVHVVPNTFLSSATL